MTTKCGNKCRFETTVWYLWYGTTSAAAPKTIFCGKQARDGEAFQGMNDSILKVMDMGGRPIATGGTKCSSS